MLLSQKCERRRFPTNLRNTKKTLAHWHCNDLPFFLQRLSWGRMCCIFIGKMGKPPYCKDLPSPGVEPFSEGTGPQDHHQWNRLFLMSRRQTKAPQSWVQDYWVICVDQVLQMVQTVRLVQSVVPGPGPCLLLVNYKKLVFQLWNAISFSNLCQTPIAILKCMCRIHFCFLALPTT